jgi:hypothetical protein
LERGLEAVYEGIEHGTDLRFIDRIYRIFQDEEKEKINPEKSCKSCL